MVLGFLNGGDARDISLCLDYPVFHINPFCALPPRRPNGGGFLFAFPYSGFLYGLAYRWSCARVRQEVTTCSSLKH